MDVDKKRGPKARYAVLQAEAALHRQGKAIKDLSPSEVMDILHADDLKMRICIDFQASTNEEESRKPALLQLLAVVGLLDAALHRPPPKVRLPALQVRGHLELWRLKLPELGLGN